MRGWGISAKAQRDNSGVARAPNTWTIRKKRGGMFFFMSAPRGVGMPEGYPCCGFHQLKRKGLVEGRGEGKGVQGDETKEQGMA